MRRRHESSLRLLLHAPSLSELDSEMVDYWQTGASATDGAGAATGAAQPAANGDANMDDEIL